jgi:serine/threonine-protein kinase RIO1
MSSLIRRQRPRRLDTVADECQSTSIHETWVYVQTDVLTCEIGTGATASVWRGVSSVDGKLVAVKIYHSNDYDESACRSAFLSQLLSTGCDERKL